jgi:SPX domain protein involved in polyphosphate accumulation
VGKVILSVEEYNELVKKADEGGLQCRWTESRHAENIETLKENHANVLGAKDERIKTLNGLVEELRKEVEAHKKELAAAKKAISVVEAVSISHWSDLIGVLNAARGRLKVKYRDDASECRISTSEKGVLKLVPMKKVAQ